MTEHPQCPRWPIRLVSMEDKSSPYMAHVEAVFRDADNWLWKADTFPCLWFDMDCIGKVEA